MPGERRTRELVGETFVVTHTIDDSHNGWRADRFLRDVYKHFSRNKLQTMIDEGRIVIEGKRLKASTTLRPGEKLKVLSERTAEPPVNFEFGVLYEDEHLLVIDKPGNLPVHPAGKFLFHTLLMELRRTRGGEFYLVHRLDRETSGVLLMAKTSPMAGELVKQFRERETEKFYWAVVEGRPEQDRFTVNADLGSDRNSEIRLKMAAFAKGTGEMDALTHFKVLRRGRRFSLVDCELMTGRQHQIRVHLAHAGFPVAGDKLYGARSDQVFLDFIHSKQSAFERGQFKDIERQALHSRYLKFWHPVLKKWFEMESALPQDMAALLEA